MKNIYIIRHAKAEGQPFSAPLTQEGREQAEALVDFFEGKDIDCIFSSPYLRTLETIRPLALKRGIDITEDERLSERVLSGDDLPDWKEKLEQSFDDFSYVLPGGESSIDAYERAASILEQITASSEDNIVIVSHGNLTTLLLRYFDGRFGFKELMELTNPDVYHIHYDGEKGEVKRIWE
ncbi:histidine phosphatase family protein [Falsibacillus pallidus]|uniref:2,3-bisphosphoglycerate-dependent phosphoglycerate mutase n=1 Tax=Falsibacillus pallidus TaxID=493781 RepID=A0A370GDR1_9BACI|nr:histidine phosphatase family protein [Falsibacillus pallidus]RDI41239.1 2,3-bisphosphoglycerate-dependent phosphoglycerate mutase [Falsibacillus pallidus]